MQINNPLVPASVYKKFGLQSHQPAVTAADFVPSYLGVD